VTRTTIVLPYIQAQGVKETRCHNPFTFFSQKGIPKTYSPEKLTFPNWDKEGKHKFVPETPLWDLKI